MINPRSNILNNDISLGYYPYLLIYIALILFCKVALADDVTSEEIISSVKFKILSVSRIAKNPAILQAVVYQNMENLTLSDIYARDEKWKKSAMDTDFKLSLQNNHAGIYLREIIEKNPAVYSEAFLTDSQGANVAAYPATSDYWQGDEEKFTESFQAGNGKIYVGSVEYDESAKTEAVQISVPVMSKEKAIGVLIVGIKLSHAESLSLIRRRFMKR